MKALTVCQPFAERIRLGLKPIENRTWSTSYRGQLAIHAGKSRSWLQPGDDRRYPGMVFGAVVCLVELYDCVDYLNLPRELEDHEDAFGPFCFLLRNVQPIEPVYVRGMQGLWEWKR